MQRTIDLLNKYQGNDSNVVISAKLNIDATTVVKAKKVGRLSPELSAKIAEILGENAVLWMAIAAAEAQKEPTRSKLLGMIKMDAAWCARRDSNPRPLPSEGKKKRRAVKKGGRMVGAKSWAWHRQPPGLDQVQGVRTALSQL